MTKTQKLIRFRVGDRVAEKPKDNYIPHINKEKIPVVLKNSTQRIGTVTQVTEKVMTGKKRKQTYMYYQVAWDNNTISEHAQFRLCHEHELATIVANYRASIE